jgi:hypothetical protein
VTLSADTNEVCEWDRVLRGYGHGFQKVVTRMDLLTGLNTHYPVIVAAAALILEDLDKEVNPQLYNGQGKSLFKL